MVHVRLILDRFIFRTVYVTRCTRFITVSNPLSPFSESPGSVAAIIPPKWLPSPTKIISEEGYVLQPSACYIGVTQEVLGSNVYVSLVTGRSSVGRKFLTNYITAVLIDQGFFGNITLEIMAYKPTRVYPRLEFGQIFWFTTFGQPYLY